MWFLHVMGFSNGDIAEMLNSTKGSVKVTLSQMRSDKSKEKSDESE